uniref:Uncharacterized protein n=1 Tax=Arundo donax TaxID=35708 RepID=A0A0A9APW4_ARUDO
MSCTAYLSTKKRAFTFQKNTTKLDSMTKFTSTD